MRYQPKATSSTSKYGSPKQSTEDNNVASVQVRSQVRPQVSPLAQVNTLAQPTHTNSFPPPPYFPIPFPPPVPPSNASIAPSAPASDLSAAISLMTNAVNQGNANTTNITDVLQKTTTQFADECDLTTNVKITPPNSTNTHPQHHSLNYHLHHLNTPPNPSPIPITTPSPAQQNKYDPGQQTIDLKH